MKKIILVGFIIVFFSCCYVNRIGVLLGIKPSGFTYKYNGQYTGIDSLININGYYQANESFGRMKSKNSFIFYSDGLVSGTISEPTQVFSDTVYDYSYHLQPLWGTYKIFGDTIRIQLLRDGDPAQEYINTIKYEFIVKDKNKLEFTENNSRRINRQNDSAGYDLNNESSIFKFYNLNNKIDSTNWLLKKKWFYEKK